MDAAVDATGEVPQHPGVHVAEQQVACLCLGASTLDVVEDPLHLGAGEVGGQGQTTDVLETIGAFVTSKLVTDLLGTGVLPHNGVIDRVAGVLVPHHGGLALVGDTDGGELVTVDAGLRESLTNDLTHRLPDLDGVVLDPAGTREDLFELLLADRDDLPGVVEDDGAS